MLGQAMLGQARTGQTMLRQTTFVPFWVQRYGNACTVP